jgi:hypothetical protein
MATGLEQSAAKVSTDRTGADDENSHNCSPSYSLVAHFNANMFVIKANRAHRFALDQTTPLM